MTVFGNSNELGQAPGRFWGSGSVGKGNLKSKSSEAENGLSLATEAGKSEVGAAYILVSFEVWLRYHLHEACLILSALLGHAMPCVVAGWWVSVDG